MEFTDVGRTEATQEGTWLVARCYPNVTQCPSYLLVASCVIADLGVGMCGRRRLPWVTWPSADFRVVASLAAGHEPAAMPPVCGNAVSCLRNPATGERPGRACPGQDVKLPAKHTKSQKRKSGRARLRAGQELGDPCVAQREGKRERGRAR